MCKMILWQIDDKQTVENITAQATILFKKKSDSDNS